jgi:hypothetical protein
MMFCGRIKVKALCRTLCRVLASVMAVAGTSAGLSAPLGAPYPPSRVITVIEWAPKETILRRAHDSDNWPMTWADDDALYTAYGDGYGFEPFLKEKLSLGLARMNGMPSNFIGENIRAPSLEQKGGGRAGLKASGLLCLDSTL